MKHYIPRVGDMIRIDRLVYQHVGIYVGPRGFEGRDVVHNDHGVGVVFSTLAEFSGGLPVRLHKQATGSAFEREEIAQRALALLGRKFNLLNFNCEHLANWAQSRKLESPQLQGFAMVALVFFGLIFLSRKS